MDEPHELPIDGDLDLHPFRPQDIKDVVNEYLDACRERGIFTVRIAHGKGIGNAMRTVHAALAENPIVESYAQASLHYGGLGATMVRLKAISD